MWNYSLKSLKYFLKKLGTFLICIHLEGTFGITQPNKLAEKITQSLLLSENRRVLVTEILQVERKLVIKCYFTLTSLRMRSKLMNLPRRLLPSFRHPRTLLNRAFTVSGPIKTLPRYHLPLAVAASSVVSSRDARDVTRPDLKRISQTDRWQI